MIYMYCTYEISLTDRAKEALDEIYLVTNM